MSTDDKKDPQVRVVDRRWWAREDNDPTAVSESGARKPTYVEDLERQLADARNRVQELTSGHRQSLEEFEQVKLRLRRDVAREVERGRRSVLAELLDVLDNLDRAIAASPDPVGSATPAAGDQLAHGVRLVRDQFLAKLEAFGVVRVLALGQPFDAARHEAVTTSRVTDPAADGTVIAVIREGYALGDDLLRPASVVVGRHEVGER